mgnify:CR=1 FL=1
MLWGSPSAAIRATNIISPPSFRTSLPTHGAAKPLSRCITIRSRSCKSIISIICCSTGWVVWKPMKTGMSRTAYSTSCSKNARQDVSETRFLLSRRYRGVRLFAFETRRISMGFRPDPVELPGLETCQRDQPAKHRRGISVRGIKKRGIPAIIMEPLLGGRLSNVHDHIVARLKQREPGRSVASWAFRFAGSFPGVLTVLSGMTYMEHLQDNLRSYCPLQPLTEEENRFLFDTADLMMQYPTIPCNDCKYCMPCPYGMIFREFCFIIINVERGECPSERTG